jgi:outer membrane protein assembly factor BamB
MVVRQVLVLFVEVRILVGQQGTTDFKTRLVRVFYFNAPCPIKRHRYNSVIINPQLEYSMALTFTPDLPEGYLKEAIIISGTVSLLYAGKAYIVHLEGDTLINVYEIRYSYSCSPFREAMLLDNILIAGYEGFFYAFDVLSQKTLLVLEMDGYFGHLYINEDHIYVTAAGTIYSIDRTGKVIWSNNNIGVDGIIIEQFTSTEISGSGEWDPPGGWKDFVLDKKTGQRKQNTPG